MLHALSYKRKKQAGTLFVVLVVLVGVITAPLSATVSENLLLAVTVSEAEAAFYCTPGTAGQPLNCGEYESISECEQINGEGQCQTLADASSKDPLSLGIVWDGFVNGALWLVNILLASFISLAGGMLVLVGIGFDEAVNYTIVNFGTTFQNFEAGVNAAWTGFRDVANIVLIAMFVFLAFAVILNSETYGLKKFGVRILLVAILINFSLFFTKAIIDLSNVTAVQFRKAIQIELQNRDGGDAGIAAAFMDYSGLSGFGYQSAKGALDGLRTDSEGNITFGSPFLYTFLIIVFYVAMATILLYGLILLIARMVVLLVLMFTSAAAFAAYMIPKHGQKWWDKWWDALVKNSLFAPLFMLMLWASLNIIQKTGIDKNVPKDSKETVGTILAMVKDPQAGWAPILNMLLVLGLLYASVKIANELSLSGAKFASKISTKGLSAALRAVGVGGALGLVGRFGRSTIGARGRRWANDTQLRQQAVEGNLRQRMLAQAKLAAGKTAAGMSFDLRDAKLAKNLEKASGVSLGKGVGSLDSYEKNRQKMVDDAANAAGEEARKRVQEGMGKAPTLSGGGTGDAGNMAKAIKESGEKNAEVTQKALSNIVGAQREENAAADRPVPTTDISGGAENVKVKPGREKQSELAGSAADIKGLTERINAERQSKLRSTINKMAGADSIPTAQTTSSPDVVQAIEGLRSDLKEGTTTVQTKGAEATDKSGEKGSKADEAEREARKAFVERYRAKSGITQDNRRTRDRIADNIIKEMKKGKDQKATDSIKDQMDKIEEAQKSLGDKLDT
ncbi:hypothetical protein CL652_00675 [bacterium]|nr:hypothetical protein [bacterium]|tara:strand:+ start:4283 stop:6658 length:2376 start_codon:yes stop_codon:yes gene_type:complete